MALTEMFSLSRLSEFPDLHWQHKLMAQLLDWYLRHTTGAMWGWPVKSLQALDPAFGAPLWHVVEHMELTRVLFRSRTLAICNGVTQSLNTASHMPFRSRCTLSPLTLVSWTRAFKGLIGVPCAAVSLPYRGIAWRSLESSLTCKQYPLLKVMGFGTAKVVCVTALVMATTV